MGSPVERVVLIGLRRAGKTTVARLLGAALGWAVVDTDEVIRSETGRTPGAWLRDAGEEAFRHAEAAAVLAIASLRQVVVATGGGVPCRQDNRDRLRPDSLVAYLRADPYLLWVRSRADGEGAPDRPALVHGPDADVEPFILHAERDALYRAWCDVVVDASRPPPESVAAVLRALAR